MWIGYQITGDKKKPPLELEPPMTAMDKYDRA